MSQKQTETTVPKRGQKKDFLKKMSTEYESRGLALVNVDNQQIGALHTENNRERVVNETLVKDVELLRAQLARAEEVRASQQTQLASAQQHINQLAGENADLKRQLDAALSEKETLQQEVMRSSDFIIAVQEKCYQSNKQSLDLLENLKDAEDEIEVLKSYIVDLKQRITVYIPNKGDPTDVKLAEYINNYPDRQKLKIMFLRESEGVYEFGSKRIMVKVERDKIQIKVGGGYLSIDEFLDQYTPAELEKLERRDPLKRFTERVAVQKVLTSQKSRDVSPQRPKTSVSPNKKKKAV